MLTAWTVLFHHLLEIHMLRPSNPSNPTVFTTSGTYGDLPFHLQLIHSFVTGANSRVDLRNLKALFFANTPLVYPFLPDFQSAVFLKSGATIQEAIIVPSVVLAPSLPGLLACIGLRMSHGRMFVALTTPLFAIFAGGWGFYSLFSPSWRFTYQDIMSIDHVQVITKSRTLRTQSKYTITERKHS